MSNYENETRIIAGLYKGKIIPVLDAEGLRPTPSKVRETIFSWLGDKVNDACVLDLFTGSGALGFEALSRKAKEVVMVELNPNACRSLKKTADSFNCGNKVLIHNTDALEFINSTTKKFDIIFVDPPYKLNIYEDVLSKILARNLIDDNSLVYVEMRNGSNHAVPGFEIVREQAAGQAKYSIWKKSSLLF